MNSETLNLLIPIMGSIMLGFLGFVWKEISNVKARKRERLAQDIKDKRQEKKTDSIVTVSDLLLQRFDSIELEVVDIKMLISKNTEFVNILDNAIHTAIDDYLNANHTLSINYKNIMMDLGRVVEEIAFTWYRSELRDKERGKTKRTKIASFLTKILDFNFAYTISMINISIPNIRLTSDHDTKGCKFSQFIKDPEQKYAIYSPYNEFLLLINALSENGFESNEAIIDKFKETIYNLFTKFTELRVVWQEFQLKSEKYGT